MQNNLRRQRLMAGVKYFLQLSALLFCLTLYAATAGKVDKGRVSTYGESDWKSPPLKTQSLTLTVTPPSLRLGSDEATLTVSGYMGTGGVSFTTTTPTICSIDGSKVKNLTAGACVMSATIAADSLYDQATADATLTVLKKQDTLSLATTQTKATVGEQLALGTLMTVTRGSSLLADSVTYTSTTTSVCEVSGGAVKILAAGTCALTATRPGDKDYESFTSDEVTITTELGEQEITMQLCDASGSSCSSETTIYTLDTGDSAKKAVATGGNGSGSISYESIITANCSVDPVTGVITPTPLSLTDERKECRIRATKVADSLYKATTKDVKYFVRRMDAEFDLSVASEGKIAVGTQVTITSTIPVVFSMWHKDNSLKSNAQCKIVSEAGETAVYEALTPGLCRVYGYAPRTDHYEATSQSILLSNETGSQAALVWVTLPTSITVGSGATTILAEGGSGTGSMSYTSTTPDTCSISGTQLQVLAAGECEVQATKAEDSGYSVASVTGSVKVNEALVVSTDRDTIDIDGVDGNGEPLYATLGASGGSGDAEAFITFSTTDESLCEISAGNKLYATAPGSCEVVATQDGSVSAPTTVLITGPVVEAPTQTNQCGYSMGGLDQELRWEACPWEQIKVVTGPMNVADATAACRLLNNEVDPSIGTIPCEIDADGKAVGCGWDILSSINYGRTPTKTKVMFRGEGYDYTPALKEWKGMTVAIGEQTIPFTDLADKLSSPTDGLDPSWWTLGRDGETGFKSSVTRKDGHKTYSVRQIDPTHYSDLGRIGGIAKGCSGASCPAGFDADTYKKWVEDNHSDLRPQLTWQEVVEEMRSLAPACHYGEDEDGTVSDKAYRTTSIYSTMCKQRCRAAIDAGEACGINARQATYQNAYELLLKQKDADGVYYYARNYWLQTNSWNGQRDRHYFTVNQKGRIDVLTNRPNDYKNNEYGNKNTWVVGNTHTGGNKKVMGALCVQTMYDGNPFGLTQAAYDSAATTDTLSWGAINLEMKVGGGAQQISASRSSGSQTIYYKTQTSDVCTVSTDGRVTPLIAGSCIVSANSDSVPQINKTITVSRNVQTLTWQHNGTALPSSPLLPLASSGDSFVMQAAPTGATTVTYESLSPTNCTVASNAGAATVTAIKDTGSCIIKATAPQTGGYNSATAQTTLAISLKANAISWDWDPTRGSPPFMMNMVEEVAFTATGQGTGAVTYTLTVGSWGLCQPTEGMTKGIAGSYAGNIKWIKDSPGGTAQKVCNIKVTQAADGKFQEATQDYVIEFDYDYGMPDCADAGCQKNAGSIVTKADGQTDGYNAGLSFGAAFFCKDGYKCGEDGETITIPTNQAQAATFCAGLWPTGKWHLPTLGTNAATSDLKIGKIYSVFTDRGLQNRPFWRAGGNKKMQFDPNKKANDTTDSVNMIMCTTDLTQDWSEK